MTKPSSEKKGKKIIKKTKHFRPAGKKKEGNVARYITRNKVLHRLQLKLPEFRRLCILKGIYPREPKKKFEGSNKTYYHAKDIAFLAHEPLLEKSRELKVYEKKINRAKAKKNVELALRLDQRRPGYTLDHIVRERYPTFIDALRDLDDALTMIHLFASLPAESSHHISAERVHSCRRLSLEWQAYISKTHSLRKTFVSVKGIYYQSEVEGQLITWLIPHALHQVIPDDVDLRVMLSFLEFYETLLGFVNYRLYYSISLKYPPLLDPRLEAVAAELYAIVKDLTSNTTTIEEHSLKEDGEMDCMDTELSPEEKEKRLEESQARLALLQHRLSTMDKERDNADVSNDGGVTQQSTDNDSEEDEDEERKACKTLFKGLKFFLGREVPRESLLFVIKSFGGVASWDGDEAPFPESDEAISHQVVDRPTQGHKYLSRDYIQPQWVYDCVNARIILPTEHYCLGRVPPPHLSPFVDNEAEGYMPDYAKTIKSLQEAAKKNVLPMPGMDGQEINHSESILADAISRRNEANEAIEKEKQEAAIERSYQEELARELQGLPYSKALSAESSHISQEVSTKEHGSLSTPTGLEQSVDDEKVLLQVMMSRKKKGLYEAMKMGKAKKKKDVQLLEERKRKLEKGNKNK